MRQQGRELMRALPHLPKRCRLIMDRAYEGNETRQLALDLGFIPVVPPIVHDESNLGNTAKPGTSVETRSSGCSAGSKAFVVSSVASISSTSCSWRSCASRSSSKHFDSVNRP